MNWRDLQSAFAEAVRNPARPVPEGVGLPRARPTDTRFNVYRNNSAVSLTEAMADSFPVVRQLVGETFFTGMARAYVEQNLPKSPVLLDYGDTFPEFIDGFEPAGSLPFLADMARLERAWTRAYHAADQTTPAIEALKAIDPEKLDGARLTLHSSVELVRSDWPVASIWSAHQLVNEDERTAALQRATTGREEHVLIVRPDFEVNVQLVERSIWSLLASIRDGASLGEAAGALDDNDMQHFGAMLNYAFLTGAVNTVEAD